jgi:hypothetical protein
MTATTELTAEPAGDQPVCKSVTVKASPDLAFRVFTADMDSWWPRSHHIGKTPMKRTIMEGKLGGRCFSQHDDGVDCDWGKIVVWEPPTRFVMAWLIDLQWQFQPDPAKASEVEVRFTAEPGGFTRVDLEHRGFARMGPGYEAARAAIGGPGGWSGMLAQFAARAQQLAEAEQAS